MYVGGATIGRFFSFYKKLEENKGHHYKMIIDIVREVYIEIEFQCNFRKKGMNCLEFQWFKMGRKMLWNKHRWIKNWKHNLRQMKLSLNSK